MYHLKYILGFCPYGLFETPSGDTVCWVGKDYTASEEDAHSQCINRGFQGLAEVKTKDDYAFLMIVDACKYTVNNYMQVTDISKGDMIVLYSYIQAMTEYNIRRGFWPGKNHRYFKKRKLYN